MIRHRAGYDRYVPHTNARNPDALTEENEKTTETKDTVAVATTSDS